MRVWHHKSQPVKMLAFSLDASPESLPPRVYRLIDNNLFEVSPDFH